MAITDTLRSTLIRNFNDRERRAVRDAQLLADNSGRVSEALRAIDPELETAVLALAEFVEFQKAIRAKVQAIGGHAAEGSDLAKSHAHDMAQTATVALNLPAVLDTSDVEPIGLEEIPAGAGHHEIERIIHGLSIKIRRWRQEHPDRVLRVGLIMDGE